MEPTVYLMVSLENEELKPYLEGKFSENDIYLLDSGKCLLAGGKKTSSQVWKQIYGHFASIEDAPPATLIVPVRDYYGFANKAVWQWIRSKRSST